MREATRGSRSATSRFAENRMDISSNSEAKALGIKMGVPVFKMRDLMERHGVKALSSDYTL